jgi:ribosomal protein S27AE
MAGTSKRVRLSAASCPKCGEEGSLKKILYGMPGPDFDHEKYIVGGCVISVLDPEIGCTRCGWAGMRGEHS